MPVYTRFYFNLLVKYLHHKSKVSIEMNKKRISFIIIIIILLIIFFRECYVYRPIQLPDIADIDINIQVANANDPIHIVGDKKLELYNIIKNLKLEWNPLIYIPNGYSVNEYVGVLITGIKTNFYLNITTMPYGDSQQNLAPYALLNRDSGNGLLRIKNSQELLNFLKYYMN